MNFFLGGTEVALSKELNQKTVALTSMFSRKVTDQSFSTLAIDVVEELPCKRYENYIESSRVILDTASTWKISSVDNQEFPYLLQPSYSQKEGCNALSLFCDHSFQKMKLFTGGWKNYHPETYLFFPYEQTLLLHHLQMQGCAAISHSAGVEIDGKGYLFMGDSGAGKSTIASLCEKELGTRAVLSDDRIILRCIEEQWWIYGTPWHGTLPRMAAKTLLLGGIFFLEKEKEFNLNRLSVRAAFDRLLPVIFGAWWLPSRLDRYLSFVSSLAKQSHVPFYRLGFHPENQVVSLLREKGTIHAGEFRQSINPS